MSLVSTTVPSLVNGVSQQAENLRYTSQCDEQVNGYSSMLRGLLKRPPTKHLKQLTLTSPNFQTVPINRTPTERYMLLLGNQTLRVFDLLGNEIPVKNKDGDPITEADLAYLATATPKTSLRALTVADYTILLNREKVVAMDTAVTPAAWPSAMIFVKQFRSNCQYNIHLYNSPTATTPSFTFGYAAMDATWNQQLIAQGLLGVFNDNAAAVALYNGFASDGLLYFDKKDGSDFRVEVQCNQPESLHVFKGTAQNFTQLPKKAWSEFHLKISGNPEDSGDEYYVKYIPLAPGAIGSGGLVDGNWEEFQALGLQDKLNPATLPHVLLNYGTYFQFKPVEWGARRCGDAATNPEPSFVGKKIREVFFTKNRLGLLADENVVLSEASEFFNFWRTTVIQLLDSDPIDVAASATGSRISILNAAVATSKRLVLFAEQTQFELEDGGMLTPKSVALPPVSDYENIAEVPPRALGDSIVFPFKRGAYSGFYDYEVDADTDLFKAYDVTEHVPSYLFGSVEAFDVSAMSNILVAKAAEADTLYVYQFFKRRRERLQSAWHRWKFGGTVRSFFILGSTLYLVIERAGAYFLESLELDPGVVDPYAKYTTLLDRRIDETLVTRSYNAMTERTVFTLPFSMASGTPRIMTRFTVSATGGEMIPVETHLDNTLVAVGNWTTVPLWFGENYVMEQTLTRPQLREQKSDGSFSVMPGRFQVRRGFLTHNDSLAFSVQVTPRGRSTFSYAYSPRDLGTDSALTGSPPTMRDGVFPFTVLSKNDQVTIKLVNDTPLPCALLSIDWEALYTLRAQRT